MAAETKDTPEHGIPDGVHPGKETALALLRKNRPSGKAWLVVCLMLAATTALRLTLAFHGWPSANSDDATLGLMVDDILWHGAHPLFGYGEHHLGAIDAYLQAPFFAALGPTNLTMHIVTTIQILVFLVIFYLFTREVFSSPVAVITLLLLAFCGEQALFFEMRPYHHAQDILVFSALLLWLVFRRLCRPGLRWQLTLLDFAIGLVAGLGLWSTLLTLPFVLAAFLALAVEAIKVRYQNETTFRGQWSIRQGLLVVIGLFIGLAPLILIAVKTHGSSLREGVSTANVGGGHSVVAIIQQLGGTFIYAVPSMFGSSTVCPHCASWPSSGVVPPPDQILVMTVIGLAFSGLVMGCWLFAVLPLARATWQIIRHTRRSAFSIENSSKTATADEVLQNARWWGRAMLAIGVGLTLLEFASSRASFVNVGLNTRYLTGIYFVMPFVAMPLWSSIQTVRRWSGDRRRKDLATLRLRLVALLGVVVLLALFGISLWGELNSVQDAFNNPQQFGVPAGMRDVQLLDFLNSYRATRFYTSWWVCYRLMFDSQEQVDCSVVSDSNPFTPGLNMVPAYAHIVAASPHPAYVFDLTTNEVEPGVPQKILGLIADRDPRFAGYTSATIDGYIIFYYK